MIPGIGRFDPGSVNGGGFEVVVGVGSYDQVRDQMLSMYREHNIAPRGMHVINKAQDAGIAELPEGGEMTLEMRQAIASARNNAGYDPLKPFDGTNDGPDLRENEAYLDGIVEKPDFDAITTDLVERMTPMTVVMARELSCPNKEVADRVNREFWNKFAEEPTECVDLVRGFAAAYVPASSKLLSLWTPAVEDSFTTAIEYTGALGLPRKASLAHHVITRSITRKELAEQGMTLRNWFAKTLCAELIERLDTHLADLLPTIPSLSLKLSPATWGDLPKHVNPSLRGKPEMWLRDTAAQERMGLAPGEVLQNIDGAQAICEDASPIEPGFIIVRAGNPGLHQELPDPFEVEIHVDDEDRDRLNFELSYWHALDIDPDARGMVLVYIGE